MRPARFAIAPLVAALLAACSDVRGTASRGAGQEVALEPDPSRAAEAPAPDSGAPGPGTAAAETLPLADPAPAPPGPRPYREGIPMAPMGRSLGHSILDGRAESPGRVVDPERDSVERGRRLVPVNDTFELSGTFDSAEDLARELIDRIRWNDPRALHELRVTKAEFSELFWPEFPQSRPATSIRAADAWAFHDGNCHDGVSEIVSVWGGRELHFTGLRFEVGFAPYTNFNLYKGVVIEAVDESGAPLEIRAASIFAERHGRWKLYLLEA